MSNQEGYQGTDWKTMLTTYRVLIQVKAEPFIIRSTYVGYRFDISGPHKVQLEGLLDEMCAFYCKFRDKVVKVGGVPNSITIKVTMRHDLYKDPDRQEAILLTDSALGCNEQEIRPWLTPLVSAMHKTYCAELLRAKADYEEKEARVSLSRLPLDEPK